MKIWIVPSSSSSFFLASREAAEALCAARGWSPREIEEVNVLTSEEVQTLVAEAGEAKARAAEAVAAGEAKAFASRAFAAWKARQCGAVSALELRCRSSRRITSRRCA